MKKKLVYTLAFMFAFFIAGNSINAATIKGENNSANNIKVTYDATTKELYAYGYNKYGGLGTGNYIDVKAADKVKLNDKIGNKKIIDYVVNLHNTYLLTEDGKVYASGVEVGNGSKKINKFVKLNLYGEKSYPIKSFNEMFGGEEISVESYDAEAVNYCKKSEKNCLTSIMMETKNAKAGYFYTNMGALLNNAMYTSGASNKSISSSSDDLTFMEERSMEDALSIIWMSKYPVLVKENKKSISATVGNAKGQKIIYYIVNNKTTVSKKYTYKNGKATSYAYYTNSKRILQKYNNGKMTSKRVTYYKNGKSVKKRRISLDHTYKYKNGLATKRTTKKRINNKLKLYSITDYKRNKKGQLKSNKNGKAYKYVKYYKNGKVNKKYKYTYNSKGKAVQKRVIK